MNQLVPRHKRTVIFRPRNWSELLLLAIIALFVCMLYSVIRLWHEVPLETLMTLILLSCTYIVGLNSMIVEVRNE